MISHNFFTASYEHRMITQAVHSHFCHFFVLRLFLSFFFSQFSFFGVICLTFLGKFDIYGRDVLFFNCSLDFAWKIGRVWTFFFWFSLDLDVFFGLHLIWGEIATLRK